MDVIGDVDGQMREVQNLFTLTTRSSAPEINQTNRDDFDFDCFEFILGDTIAIYPAKPRDFQS